MSTATKTSTPSSAKENAAPEITILTRVASIPIVSSSIQTIEGALLNNTFTASPYATAKGLSNVAYRLSEPLQIRLAPLIVQADGIANKAVDVVEQRYPYPFKAKPEEVVSMVREKRKSASDYAQKTIDDKVKSPAYAVAQDIDQRFTPIADYFEVAVTRLNGSTDVGSSTPSDTQYQYQRILALSKSLRDSVSIYSSEQMKQIQSQNMLVQRASETAQSITNLASSSINQAQTRIHTLSDNMLAELSKLQASTASLSHSLQESVQNSASQIQSQLPPQVQQTYNELSTNLSSAVTELRGIITQKDMPLQEKVSRVGHEVRDRVAPLLESVRKGISELLVRGKTEAAQATGNTPPSRANGKSGRR